MFLFQLKRASRRNAIVSRFTPLLVYLSHVGGWLIESRGFGFRMRSGFCRIKLWVQKPPHGTRATPVVIVPATYKGLYLSRTIMAFARSIFAQRSYLTFVPGRRPRVILFIRRKILGHSAFTSYFPAVILFSNRSFIIDFLYLTFFISV